MITEIFNLISKLKLVKKEKYNIDDYDMDIMKSFHRKLKGLISFRTWKNIVIKYSIDTGKDIYDSCDDLVDVIYDKYKNKK